MCKLRPLNKALAKKAATELNENSENVQFSLNALRAWVQQQTHLRARIADQFLIVFLRAAKFSLEIAKHKLENYYVYRAAMPELFKNRNLNDPKVYAIIKSGCLLHLPEPAALDGPRVIMIRPKFFDMSKHTVPDVFRVGAMATDILLYEDDNAIVAGYIIIMDLGHVPKSVLYNFDPNFVRKVTILANKISPTRMKGFHFLNVPPIFEKLFNMVKSVINVKLRQRFYIHGNNLEQLYEHIPRHILPKEYGGQCVIDTIQEYIWQKLLQQSDFLKEEESYGLVTNVEKLNYSRHVLNNNDSGIPGNFRKLNVD